MPDRTNYQSTKHSEQEIANLGFDETTNSPFIESVGYDGVGLQKAIAQSMAMKVTVSGSVTYVAIAAPGTAQDTAKWQVKKIDETSGTVITWADGDANFDNTATDLTAHSYS